MGRGEILAPAGGMESLRAAVRCGAHAVYVGGKGFSARAGAENFDRQGLREAADYCHVRGAKLYLALNTLVFDRELDELERAVREACEAGVDALIVQDLAVAALARRMAPGLPLHGSTQMSVHSADGARMLEELGFSRVVLARELSREETAAVLAGTSLEVECFVHGALCMCVSGQCTLSSVIGGRSGNRGRCAQPCRLPFSSGEASHDLSLKDLSLVSRLRELRELGVASFKIEGRLKRPEYVAAAVTACKQALAGEAPDLKDLQSVFSRSGFTDGYYTDRRGSGMFGTRQKEDVTAASAVLDKLAGLYREERPLVPVRFDLRLQEGRPALLTLEDRDGSVVTVQGEPPQAARTAPTTAERAAAALGKTGGTPFFPEEINCKIDPGLIIPASALNALRRQALEELEKKRARRPQVSLRPAPAPKRPRRTAAGRPRLRVRLAKASQLMPGLHAEEIALPVPALLELDPELFRDSSRLWLAELPRVRFARREELLADLERLVFLGVSHALAGTLDSLALAKRAGMTLHGDFGLNITNTLALEEYEALGLADATLSMELELARAKALGGDLPRGILAYGHLPLMLTRSKPAGLKARPGETGTLTDRLGNRFPVLAGPEWEAATLYNYVPLYLADRLEELGGMDFLTLYVTQESPAACAALAAEYRSGGPPRAGNTFTRGLYYRRVH